MHVSKGVTKEVPRDWIPLCSVQWEQSLFLSKWWSFVSKTSICRTTYSIFYTFTTQIHSLALFYVGPLFTNSRSPFVFAERTFSNIMYAENSFQTVLQSFRQQDDDIQQHNSLSHNSACTARCLTTSLTCFITKSARLYYGIWWDGIWLVPLVNLELLLYYANKFKKHGIMYRYSVRLYLCANRGLY